MASRGQSTYMASVSSISDLQEEVRTLRASVYRAKQLVEDVDRSMMLVCEVFPVSGKGGTLLSSVPRSCNVTGI
ncbi:hypothetical protein SCP_0410950 [Sparassis crispa]|uniref:Uncharacterized protein n=1 Tax=Sparassis crispa TaxID=139825 RepID=A0A401GKM8_9APHY|nr:hypothetical protein SCP_0410950 [Sparassis crispa]GBE82710.1 hypothetical protein SCP_0410950 [Sparassis crispa]